jgi:hypothetical protein
MPNAVDIRFSCLVLLSLATLFLLNGCFERESWTRAELFVPPTTGKSVKTIDATIDSVAFLGGMQRGLNLDLDESVNSDQGPTRKIYLEQPVQLPTGIVMLRRVRVHFDAAGSPLFIERIEPTRSP